MDIRSRKLEELIKIKLSELLLKGLKDPRLEHFITILQVRLSKDGRRARVVVSVIGSDEQKSEALQGLQSAHGFIQKRLSKELRVRYVPHLDFLLDRETENRVRLVYQLGSVSKESEETVSAEEPLDGSPQGGEQQEEK
jgi:ribosome-binding factor A